MSSSAGKPSARLQERPMGVDVIEQLWRVPQRILPILTRLSRPRFHRRLRLSHDRLRSARGKLVATVSVDLVCEPCFLSARAADHGRTAARGTHKPPWRPKHPHSVRDTKTRSSKTGIKNVRLAICFSISATSPWQEMERSGGTLTQVTYADLNWLAVLAGDRGDFLLGGVCTALSVNPGGRRSIN